MCSTSQYKNYITVPDKIKLILPLCGNAFKILQTVSFTILHCFNDTYELKIVKCQWLLWAC